MNLALELARRGIKVKKHGSKANEIRLNCPFCTMKGYSVDTKYRFGLNLVTGKANCFNCNFHSARSGVILLLRRIGADTREPVTSGFEFKNTKPKKIVMPEGFQKLEEVDENDPLFGQARRYVKKRGITTRQLHEHEIGATVTDDFFRYRIIFPMRVNGKLTGLVGRDWTGKSDMKYLNSIGEKVVYGCDLERFGSELVIVSEGITKALAIERALNYKVCSASLLGNHITDFQANRLKVFDEVVLFPDPDVPGMKGFLNAALNLQSVVKKVSIVWPWPTEQADDMQPEDIREVINGRKIVNPLLHMKIKGLITERSNVES